MAAVVFKTQSQQLARAASDVADARTAYENALELRDKLIIEASDLNMPQRAIAAAARLKQPRIIAIIRRREGFLSAEEPPQPPPPTPGSGDTRSTHRPAQHAAHR